MIGFEVDTSISYLDVKSIRHPIIERINDKVDYIPNDVTIGGDLAVNGGDITSTAATFNLLNTSGCTTVNAFTNAGTLQIGKTSGTATINNPTVVGTQTTQNPMSQLK